METKTLDIPVILPGYYEDCLQCLERLKTSLLSIQGIQQVLLDPQSSTVTLTYDSNYVSMGAIEQQARQIGVSIAETYSHELFTLTGLDCPDCAQKMEKTVAKLKGVVWASVNYAASTLSVEYESARTDSSVIMNVVRRLGYEIEERASISERIATPPVLRSAWLNPKVITTAIAGILLASGYMTSVLGGSESTVRMLYLASIVFGGFYPTRTALYSVSNLSIDTNLLMTVAAIGALALGEYLEAGMVLFLFSLGSALESYTVDKTRRSISSLLDISPPYALVRRDGTESLLPVEEVNVGDTVIVKPGERISMDGVIITGSSAVDQSPITGESLPKDKNIGDQVFAGTINGHGALEISVTRLVGDNTLSRIIHMVEEAQAQKAPSQRFSERFGQIYTPMVIGLAAVLTIVPWAILGMEFSEWFRRSLILLVVACPCALVIATPVAVVAAIGNAAKNGVLVKGGTYLEELGRVSVVAFDKTGTLTSGQLEVTDVLPLNNTSEKEVLAVAAAVESRSEHPLADAIIRKSKAEGVSAEEINHFEALPGRGAKAIAGEHTFYVGNHRLTNEFTLSLPQSEEIARLEDAGKTLVYVGVDDRVIGVIAASDTVKDSSVTAIKGLRNAGIKQIVMLTGDNAATANSIAKSLGINEVRAELLPEDKVEAVRTLVDRRESVAMVGDGINDAPALAAANVGIAMGAAGTHAALEIADMALIADDLTMLPYAISLSRRTVSVIKQNIVFSLLVVLLLISSTLAGFLTLTGGVLGHESSALLVIANSMRLLTRKN